MIRVLRMIAAVAASLVAASSAIAQHADLVVRNATVLTVDARHARESAFAVAGGRFVAVGSDRDVMPLIGPKTRVVDLLGKTVVPGFIDAHAHPSPVYPEDRLWAKVELSPPRIRTMDDLVAALKRKAEKTPKGSWVIGEGYHDTILGGHPTRRDLDRVSVDHPVMVVHSSAHIRACNSYCLNLAKLDRDAKNPPGGEYERDRAGELTGVLKEPPAWSAIVDAGPTTPEPPRSETVEGYRRRFREWFGRGITSVHVAGVTLAEADRLADAVSDDVPMHLVVMLREDAIDEAIEGSKKTPPRSRVRFGPIKFFHGNSLSGRTCWLSKPYFDRPDYFGIPPARSQAKLDALVLRIHRAGLQACIHANGDREIDMVLDAYENALAMHHRADHRHRIEHCSVVRSDILKRIASLGLVVAPHSYVFEHGDKMEAYGPDRWDWMHANRSMIDLGIPVAANSDFPISAADPLLRIQSMLTRRCEANGKVYGAKQRTTADQALAAWTRGGAFAAFEEGERGSIEVGKRADFVVLAADPTRSDPESVRSIAVVATAIAGRVVAGELPSRP